MSNFRTYKRINTEVSETIQMRPLTTEELNGTFALNVELNKFDIFNGSPKKGDMIAKHPKIDNFLKLVSKEYFENNFKLVE